MTEETNVKLPVTVTRNPGSSKSRRYTATYGPWQSPIEAEGSTAAEAKANLTAALVTALQAIRENRPKFARDDNGDLMVAVASYSGGSDHWRVNGSARLNTFHSGPPAEAFDNCWHMTVIPERV